MDWILVAEIGLLVVMAMAFLAWAADAVGGAGFWSNFKDVSLGLFFFGGRIAIVALFLLLIFDVGRRIIT